MRETEPRRQKQRLRERDGDLGHAHDNDSGRHSCRREFHLLGHRDRWQQHERDAV